MKSIDIDKNLSTEQISQIKEAISKDKSLLHQTDVDKRSLLQLATVNDYIDLAEFLIDKGIDVNHQDVLKSTALHYCAEYNRYEIAKKILNHGGDLNLADKYGNQPLWTAAFNDKGYSNRIKISELFLNSGADKRHKNNANRSPDDIASRYKGLSELFANYN
ncbi:ankyrin repeat domain-containing protein [Mucilaginibacter paludis]|uniref:Ankyrin n=1 Tax=Mucilaginibacter paludis DSM 18603 TaxID=714943 RepID=H1YER6_9SPHI|nr:ankyrin repeat domain-containing protein [Mucilaginibacter paludis]EHQ24333.1 Ankyrin [Mucilaginibacter paludis DSM 18603]